MATIVTPNPQPVPDDTTRVNVMTNAIAWVLYGTDGLEMVEVEDAQIDQCRAAAERALNQLRDADLL